MNKVLFDKAIDYIVEQMKKSDYIAGMFPTLYGRAERHMRYDKGKKIEMPIIYDNAGEYIDARPSDRIGNSSFWYVHDGQEVLNSGNAPLPKVRARVSVIFWFGTDVEWRIVEEVKNKLLWTLNNMRLPNGSMTVNRIYEEPENVYEDFTITDDQLPYMMHPYGGLRFECEMTVQQECVKE